MKPLKNEEGTALILALLVTTILTMFTMVAAMSTSNGMRAVTGYKNRTAALYKADGAADYSAGIIARAIGNDLQIDAADLGSANVSIDITDSDGDGITDLEDEIMGITTLGVDTYASTPPNVTIAVANSKVNMDIDFVRSKQLPGSSTEFAARYEGIGAGSSGGIGLYYGVEANGTNADRNATVRVHYKCVEGGGRCL